MSLYLPPPTPNLQYLPAELVDEIAQYLSPLSKLSLRYSCHRFRHYFPITIQSMQKGVSTKAIRTSESATSGITSSACWNETSVSANLFVAHAVKRTTTRYSQSLASEQAPGIASPVWVSLGYVRIALIHVPNSVYYAYMHNRIPVGGRFW